MTEADAKCISSKWQWRAKAHNNGAHNSPKQMLTCKYHAHMFAFCSFVSCLQWHSQIKVAMELATSLNKGPWTILLQAHSKCPLLACRCLAHMFTFCSFLSCLQCHLGHKMQSASLQSCHGACSFASHSKGPSTCYHAHLFVIFNALALSIMMMQSASADADAKCMQPQS